MNNEQTREEIRSRIANIEEELHRLTAAGSSTALGALAGLSLGAIIPGIGLILAAAATATGTSVATAFIKKKRDLQKELEELRNRLKQMEANDNAK